MASNHERWLEGSEILPMFPTFVWKARLEAERREVLNRRVLGVIEELRRSEPALQPGEAWQSRPGLHSLAELGDLVACVRTTVRSVLRFLRVGYEHCAITGCWANVGAPGASHRMHSHPNNFLSGAYYVQVQPGADTITFHDPRNQTGIIRPPVTELTAENTDQVVVRVESGSLLMFPAYLHHSVDPNRSDQVRISVSFNVMFSAFTENLAKPLWGED